MTADLAEDVSVLIDAYIAGAYDTLRARWDFLRAQGLKPDEIFVLIMAACEGRPDDFQADYNVPNAIFSHLSWNPGFTAASA